MAYEVRSRGRFGSLFRGVRDIRNKNVNIRTDIATMIFCEEHNGDANSRYELVVYELSEIDSLEHVPGSVKVFSFGADEGLHHFNNDVLWDIEMFIEDICDNTSKKDNDVIAVEFYQYYCL